MAPVHGFTDEGSWVALVLGFRFTEGSSVGLLGFIDKDPEGPFVLGVAKKFSLVLLQLTASP